MKIKLLITTLLILIAPFYAYANNPINDFLSAAETDVNDVKFTDLNATDMNAIGSWFEDAQLRFNTETPTNNIDFEKDGLTYEFRIKPKAWGQRDIENNIINLRARQQEYLYSQLLNSALQKRYFRLLVYLEQYNNILHLLKTSKLFLLQSNLIQSQVLSEQFNPERLLNIEDALKHTEEMLEVNLARLNSIQTQMGMPLDSIDSLKAYSDINWVINVSEIHNHTSTNDKDNPSPPEVLNARLKLQLSESEHQLTEAKQRIGINLLKFEYNDRRRDDMGFLLGINIPLGTSFSDTENIHDLYAAKAQLSTNIIKTKQSLTDINKEIAWLSKDSELIQKQIVRVEKHLQTDYARNYPFILLNLRKALIDYKQKIANINQKALVLYVNYLVLSGQLIQRPLRNWIQHGTPYLSHSTAD